MARFAIDMLSTTIDPAAIKAAGFVAVLRYLRNLTAPEVAGYLNAGLGVGTIFETDATRSLGGAAAGTADGQLAASQAAGIGQPHGTLLAVNLSDFAAGPSDIPPITTYWRSFKDAVGDYQVCGYATGYVIDMLVKQGEVGPWWQNAMNDSSWIGNRLHPDASLYQDTQVTLPLIAGTPVTSYDQDAIIAPLKWWTTATPDPPIRKEGQPMMYRNTATGAVVAIDGSFRFLVHDPTDLQAFAAAGMTEAQVSDAQFQLILNA